ncbi:Protein of unknown function [Bacillus cereus]|uniref:Uncharacterized protein n=1 Tax=Bacillus wiedmannii TaxID=1890302 RepID=A0AB37YNR6_9BACI|nr:Protein of unknown function [Bacillus wiedmannii]SCC14333.1 Protein of unknown function [Bacillus cereus]SCC15324.1 Protein of unknown function [Bacillus mycoides]SCL91291.1 Protein of unknown function [Bacillus wiedmannii]SCM86658.1 Protein of unknown function [Bacillus mycoides]
MLVGEGPY